MLFNLRGIEIDVALPNSLAEVNRRIENLASVQQRLQEELQKLPPKSVPRQIKGHAIQETGVELQILKRWRRNANIRLEKLLADPTVGEGELQTEAGLLKHLYLELRRLNREHQISIERDSKLATVLSAAQLWLRNYYSTKLPSTELVKDVMPEDQAHQQQHQRQQDEFDRVFQERERVRWQEHVLTQQKLQHTTASPDRAQAEALQQQQEQIRRAKQERKRQQQEEALRMQREQAETQAALNLISQFSKQASQSQ